jgi:voltage-gated potassium channel
MPFRSVPALVSSASYQLFMLALCVYALATLAVGTVVRLDPGVKAVLEYADYAVCFQFFVDFLISLWCAENRGKYLLTWGWLDLLSSIPTLSAARWGRLGRILRLFRMLRGFRATQILTTVVLKHRAGNSFLTASLAAILLIVFCSIAMLEFEGGGEGNIKTPEDAIWWAVSTVTTVGYGDRYPVTAEGRFVAAILMCAGVGLFSTMSACLAAWFIMPETHGKENEISALRHEVAALREAIERLTGERGRSSRS